MALLTGPSLSAMEHKYQQQVGQKQSTDYKKWLSYAQEDVQAADLLMQYPNEFSRQATILAFQSGEKSLKAYLTYKKKNFKRTHDLRELFALCKEDDEQFEEVYNLIARLSMQAPGIRYPNKNSLINPEGISDYRKKLTYLYITSAQSLYQFIVDKIHHTEETKPSKNLSVRPNERSLLEAINHNNTELVELLLQEGANINATNKNGESALFLAVELSTRSILGADWTARQEARSMVKLLLRNGADVNLQNNDGETALFCAAGVSRAQLQSPSGYSSLKLVKLLIKHGADATIKNNIGETVLTAEKRERFLNRSTAKRIREVIQNQ
jgi:HEPN domain-containing protein